MFKQEEPSLFSAGQDAAVLLGDCECVLLEKFSLCRDLPLIKRQNWQGFSKPLGHPNTIRFLKSKHLASVCFDLPQIAVCADTLLVYENRKHSIASEMNFWSLVVKAKTND